VHYSTTPQSNAAMCLWNQKCTTTSTDRRRVQDSRVGRRRVGPTRGFVASPEVGPGGTVGTLQTGYPYIQVLSQGKERDVYPRIATCTAASDPAFCQGGLRHRHVLSGFGPHLPAREGSSATMCTMAPDPASLQRRALAPSRVLWRRCDIPPLSSGG
jgi:hypothetical protein